MHSYKVTVFTATYNRGYCLERVYRSLQAQTYDDFEWLIIDDGSTDNTPELVAAWQAESNSFPVHYHQVANGGKVRALNLGADLAQGELFCIVDSDDWLTDESLERVVHWESTIADKSRFAGIIGLKQYANGEIVGGTFTGSEYVDATWLGRDEYGITGDKLETFYTDICRRFRHPEIPGEKFTSLLFFYAAISEAGFQIRWVNDVLLYGDYLGDGITQNITKRLSENPVGYGRLVQLICRLRRYPFHKRLICYHEYYRDTVTILSTRECARNLGIPVFMIYLIIMLKKLSALYKSFNNH